jgi:hypothetical protein
MRFEGPQPKVHASSLLCLPLQAMRLHSYGIHVLVILLDINYFPANFSLFSGLCPPWLPPNEIVIYPLQMAVSRHSIGFAVDC